MAAREAVSFKKKSTVKLLLERKDVDVNSKDNYDGRTPPKLLLAKDLLALPIFVSHSRAAEPQAVHTHPTSTTVHQQVFIPTNIYGQPVRSWLKGWIRLDEQVAKLKVMSVLRLSFADQNDHALALSALIRVLSESEIDRRVQRHDKPPQEPMWRPPRGGCRTLIRSARRIKK